MEAVHEPLHQHPVRRSGGRLHLAGFRQIHAQRLVAEDVLAVGQRPQGPLLVEMVGEADVDTVDTGVLQQLPVTGIAAVNAVLGGEGLGLLPGTGPQSGQLRRSRLANPGNHGLLGDHSHADDGHPEHFGLPPSYALSHSRLKRAMLIRSHQRRRRSRREKLPYHSASLDSGQSRLSSCRQRIVLSSRTARSE